MQYVYPVILCPDDDKIGITVPDLKGCHTFGHDTADALIMAKDAIEGWLCHAEDEGWDIPKASKTFPLNKDETITLVVADTTEYRKATDTRAIKKTLSIPSWLNRQAEKANAPFSQILQEGLKNYLKIAN